MPCIGGSLQLGPPFTVDFGGVLFFEFCMYDVTDMDLGEDSDSHSLWGPHAHKVMVRLN